MAAQERQAVLLAESDIEDEDVGRVGPVDDRSSFVKRPADRDDLHVWLTGEYSGRPITKDRMVVDDGDPNQLVAGHSTPTCIPRSGRRSNSSRAPICSARWAMFRSP